MLIWANAACEKSSLQINPENLRKVLGHEVIGLIRFSTIRKEDFASVVGKFCPSCSFYF